MRPLKKSTPRSNVVNVFRSKTLGRFMCAPKGNPGSSNSIHRNACAHSLVGHPRTRGICRHCSTRTIDHAIKEDLCQTLQRKSNGKRFLGSVRRECLDHILILDENHLYRVIKKYVAFFNQARPHQGIEQKIPEGIQVAENKNSKGKIIAFPVLNGLHHDYRRAA